MVRYLCRVGVEDVFCCVRAECLRVLQCCGSVCPATSSSLTRATADGPASNCPSVHDARRLKDLDSLLAIYCALTLHAFHRLAASASAARG
jgi:hypothetical protein